MKLYKFAWKHIVDGTYVCSLCQSQLVATDVIDGEHHFTPGQLYTCTCGKSGVWANSIRYPESLIKWCDGEEFPHHEDPTTWGFCNDTKCPFCWKYVICLKNSYSDHVENSEWWVKYFKDNVYQDATDIAPMDLYGCDNPSCSNKNLILVPNTMLGEKAGQEITAQWYKDHQTLWRNKV